MRRLTLIGILSLLAMLAVTASSAFAKNDPTVSNGSCSAASEWNLKAKADDGRIETEFEVDQNRAGQRWRVTLTRGGTTVFSGIRTTAAPSGSFTVRRLLAGPASGRIVATATALQGGETCRARLSL
jgi:hypothetical protein